MGPLAQSVRELKIPPDLSAFTPPATRGFLRTSPKTLAAVFNPVFSLRWPVLSVPAPTKIGQVLKHKI